MTNQPPIAILVEHYLTSWRYVNLSKFFTRGWKFSLLRSLEKLITCNGIVAEARTTLHKMIVEGLSMPAALKEKLKPILAPKG